MLVVINMFICVTKSKLLTGELKFDPKMYLFIYALFLILKYYFYEAGKQVLAIHKVDNLQNRQKIVVSANNRQLYKNTIKS